MLITVVISMLIVLSYHFFIVGCSKFRKDKRSGAENSQMCVPATNVLANTPGNASRVNTVVEREDGDSVRTKAGNMKESKEPDSTDDAFKDLAARLAKKEKADKTVDSLFGDDDENPIAAFQMPERPVVDTTKQLDGLEFGNIVEMEKKPVTVKPKKTAGSTPVAPPKTAKDRSVMEEPAKSRMSAVKSVKKLSKKSQREEAVTTDKTQSEPHGKVHAEIVEKTQMETVDDTDVAKTQGEDARTNASISVKNKKRDLKSKS